MTITRSGMTPVAIEEIITQHVTESLAAQEVNRAARLEAESESQNGDEGNNNNDNGIGGRNVNNRNGNPNGGAGRDAPVARVCTYKDFLNCQPRNFSGTEGVIGLARWFEKMELVFRISNYPLDSQVKFATYTLLDGALTWFQELTLLCPRMVLEEDDKIKRMASSLMDQKVRTYVARSTENKRKLDSNPRDKRTQPPPFKRQNVGHYKSDCPKMKSQNRGNKFGNAEERGSAYAIGRGGANPYFNIVTGTFLLNDRYASMLFNSGVDKSFVSTTFSALLDVIPSTLNISYAVELADGRVA
ncbi:hypothetical protein Tco_0666601 [Tanacetum coccineum]